MKWLTMFLQYFPVVLSGVVGAQVALQNQSGATKKAVVLNAILAGAHAGEQIPEAHVAGISQLIDNVVTTLKATDTTGLFKKSSPTPETEPPAVVVAPV